MWLHPPWQAQNGHSLPDDALFDRYFGMKLLTLLSPAGDAAALEAYAQLMTDEIDILKLHAGRAGA